jgi:hypothetical protein
MQAPVADPTFTSTMIPLRVLVTAKPTKLTATAVPTHGSDTSSDSPSVSPSDPLQASKVPTVISQWCTFIYPNITNSIIFIC